MKVVTEKKTPSTEHMPQTAKGIDADDLRAFIGWSTRFRIGPDDPFWGAVLATRISYQAATVSMGAAADLSSQVAKIPEIIFQGANRAANEVTASIAGQSDAFVSRLEAGGRKFARNFYAEVEPLLDQSMEKGKDTLEKALLNGSLKLEKAEKTLLAELSSNAIQSYIQGAKREVLATFTDEARKAAQAAVRSDLSWSYAVTGMVIFLLVLAGWIGNDVYLHATSQITPEPIQQYTNGKPYCHQSGQDYVCVLTKAPAES
ncbi:hypothetical protein AAE485_10290 [Acidithiobacillus ferriphilus]|uniref:hypothetical protein n=1 Tax=Acidithiobacillus ferriphilus TaxID=1689834 RepID=UPI00390C750D